MRLIPLSISAAGLFAAVLSVGPAWAQKKCDAPQTTVDMIDCAGMDLDAADRELNAVYGTLASAVKMDVATYDLLRDAQRKWIGLRDADCKLEADSARGGTAQPVLEISCKAQTTKERVKRLKELLEIFK